MCQHTCSIYTEHVFIHIYICLVYNIGHVSLMCEDTCMHIAYTDHLFIMCEYTCLVRDTCPGLAPVFCPPIWPLAPPCWSPHKNCPRPSHRRAAAACRPADSCSRNTARGTLVVLTRGFGPLQSFIKVVRGSTQILLIFFIRQQVLLYHLEKLSHSKKENPTTNNCACI